MRKLIVGSITLVVLLASSGLLPGVAAAAGRNHPFRIGVLTESWGSTPWAMGLRSGLVELGYHEHEDFVIGVRFTRGDLTALPTAARQLVKHGVDFIIVSGDNAAKAAKSVATRIPIIFTGVEDPVGSGLVTSFARPGGSITGVTNLNLALNPKRLEIFQEVVPTLKRVLFPYDANDAYAVAAARLYRDAARRLGIKLVEQAVQTEAEAQATLAQLHEGEVEGILAPRSISLNMPGFALEAAAQRMIPTMFHTAFYVERGGLISYGPNMYESGRQAARLVSKILKGANPAGIPVEVNTKIEFVINLKVARQFGITIPPTILYQATKVIR